MFFEALRLSDEARLILSEQDIEFEETAQKEAIEDVLATLDEKSRKTSRPSIGHWRGLNSENTAPVRFVERKSMRTALRQFPGHLSVANMQRQNERVG